ncbi:MAG: response regulator, partial [Desulfobulbaceae bacterium]|nr:response regulator [Desulfobulbaceae bacterium]
DQNQQLMSHLAGPLYLSNKLIGVLIIESSVANIISSIGDYTGLGETGETILARHDENGDALFITPTRFNPDAALKMVVPKEETDKPITQVFLDLHDMLVEAVDYRDVPVLATTRHVEETDWGIVVKIDTAEAMAPIKNIRNLLTAIGLAAILLLLLLSFYLSKTITRPISRLTKTAKNISEGDLHDQADEKMRDETGILAQAFNRMTENLIASHKKLEKKIEEIKVRENEIRLLLNSTAEAIYGIDRHGNCTFCNPSCLHLLGYDQESDLLGKQMHTLMHHRRPDGSEYPREECKIMQGLRQGEAIHVDDEVFWRADATCFWAEYWTHPVEQENENLKSVVTFIDISKRRASDQEREKLNTQLQQAQKLEAVGTLAGGIAHDFNNILTAILGYADLAKIKLASGSEVTAHLEEVLKAGGRAQELVKQILTFSRQTKDERKPLQIHLIIKEALKLLRASIPKTIEFRENIDQNCGMVMADPTQIHQVMMNLCTNAYQAMRETGGILAVELSRVEITQADQKVAGLHLLPGPYIELQVSDTGHGMPRSLQERIFEPYFTTKDKGKGTGMGLALVHGIVKSHEGHITVYSEPGKGSSFQVYLPRIETIPLHPETEINQAIPTGNEMILVIDDEDFIVNFEQLALEEFGYRVTATTSSVEALEIFSEQPENFDLIITDMTMPTMTGAELAQKILAARPEIPIILCTGFSELINEQKAKAIGIREYIMKPIIISEIALAVRRVLDEKPGPPAGRS